MIKKQGGKYVVKTADGSRALSKPKSLAAAKKQLAAIEISKKRRARGY